MTTIITKNSSTAGAAPLAGDLVQGELAVNVTSKALYTKNASGTVVKLNTPSIVDNGDATAITIDSSENVGIGTSSPLGTNAGRGNLTINGSTDAILAFGNAGSLAGYILQDSGGTTFNSSGATYQRFYTNSSERARIDSSGNLLVGKTSAGSVGTAGLEINPTGALFSSVAASTNSNSTLHAYSTTAAAYRFYVGMGGTVFATSTTISAISDIRFKENVRDLDDGLDKIMALKPRRYDWKEGKGPDIKNARGFIAQEYEQVFPDLIDEWRDPAPEGEEPYKSVRQDLIPVLVKAIQELKADLDATKAELAAMKGQA